MRSIKHTKNFKYTRHSKQVKAKKALKFRNKMLAKYGHVEFHSPKVYWENGEMMLSLRFYTRKLIGDK